MAIATTPILKWTESEIARFRYGTLPNLEAEIKRLRKRIAELETANEHLRELIQAAYEEGHKAGRMYTTSETAGVLRRHGHTAGDNPDFAKEPQQ